jgi:peptidoglycan-N-acetylglucosamine deacetylase
MTPPNAPLASISLDLDDLWTYLRTHGDPAWVDRPSYLAEFIPLVLDALDQAQVKLTFFVVGSDAVQPRNRALLRAMVERGHELGNHSFEHEPYFHTFSRQRIEDEVLRTQEAIADATGRRPIGFRGPGYSWSPELLEILVEQGYHFDASTLPTYLGPLARAYYFWSSNLGREERAKRKELFGAFRDGARPITPYQWELNGHRLLEIPVSTWPVVKIPFHLSYLNYLSRIGEPLAIGYLHSALASCRLTGASPSFLLHPLDFLGGDRVNQLAFFPAMDRSTTAKLRLFHRTIEIYRRYFSLVPMSVHAHALSCGPRLALRSPKSFPLQYPLAEG